MGLQCFLVEETRREQRYLRRFRIGECTRSSGHSSSHDGMVLLIEDAPITLTEDGYHCAPEERPSLDDPRWPVKCTHCDYVFTAEDSSQVACLTWYVRPDTGERFLQGSLPPGAMFDAWWMNRKGPDGKCWMVILPDGHQWMVDGPSKSGGFWVRSGVAPALTAHPSILTATYHGWLTAGILNPC